MQDVVNRHQDKLQHRRGEHGGFVHEFTRRVGGKKVRVIAEVKRTECWLITGWFEEDED